MTYRISGAGAGLPIPQNLYPTQLYNTQTDIGSNRQNLAIVEAVLAMCRSLDLVAVAEGIETEEQARTLRALGCPCGQGYLFGRPGPAEELTRLLNSPTRGMSLLAA